MADPDALRQEIVLTGQSRTLWDGTFVDLFFANTDFHLSMSERVARQPFAGREIAVLSIEDLIVCKALFDRLKDWVDIEAVARTRRGELDYTYVMRWLREFVPDDDLRCGRLGEIERDAA